MFSFLTFVFLTGIPIGIVRSAIASKICVIIAENKYKSIIKKKAQENIIINKS